MGIEARFEVGEVGEAGEVERSLVAYSLGYGHEKAEKRGLATIVHRPAAKPDSGMFRGDRTSDMIMIGRDICIAFSG